MAGLQLSSYSGSRYRTVRRGRGSGPVGRLDQQSAVGGARAAASAGPPGDFPRAAPPAAAARPPAVPSVPGRQAARPAGGLRAG